MPLKALDPEERLRRRRESKSRNRLKNPEYYRRYKSENRDKMRAYRTKYNHKNRDGRQRVTKEWKQKNRGRVNAYDAKRKAIKLSTRVESPKAIAAFYQSIRDAESICCHWCKTPVIKEHRQVDHIIPLSRGGVHRVSNLC